MAPTLAYAARGRAETDVRLALVVCAGLTSSAPLGSQSGASLLRRSLSSPRNLYLMHFMAERHNSNLYRSNVGSIITENLLILSKYDPQKFFLIYSPPADARSLVSPRPMTGRDILLATFQTRWCSID